MAATKSAGTVEFERTAIVGRDRVFRWRPLAANRLGSGFRSGTRRTNRVGPAHFAGGHTPAVIGEAIALTATERRGVEIGQTART